MQRLGNDVDRYPVSFTGSGSEYFKIWIVNILLTIVTLYIYSAWAKVRTMRYFSGNTVLDGSAFDYHAKPMQILVGRVLAVLLFAAVTFSSAIHPLAPVIAGLVLFIVAPWAVWRSTIFNARMTSYRNVRFGFTGRLGVMYWCLLVLPFLPLFVAAAIAGAIHLSGGAGSIIAGAVGLGIAGTYALSPLVHKTLAEYLADNYRYGRAEFAASFSTVRFYAIYFKAFLLSIGLLIVFGAVFGGVAFVAGTSMFGDAESTDLEGYAELGAAMAPLILYPVFFMAGSIVSAYFASRLREHLYGNVIIDKRVHLESTVRLWPLWRLRFGNLFLLIFTLGLGWPWVKVRNARFFARNTAVLAPEGLHAVIDDIHADQSAFAEELGDAFDMDVDVGF